MDSAKPLWHGCFVGFYSFAKLQGYKAGFEFFGGEVICVCAYEVYKSDRLTGMAGAGRPAPARKKIAKNHFGVLVFGKSRKIYI